MDDIGKMWHESALLCDFLAKNDNSLSESTRDTLVKTIISLITKATRSKNVPDPF